MNDIYKAPSADLSAPAMAFDGTGSVENGIAGNYEFSIGALIDTAWQKTNGNKGTIWLGILIFIVILIPTSVVTEIAFGSSIGGKFLSQIIQTLISAPLTVGLYLMGIKIAASQPTSPSEVIAYFKSIVPLAITMVLMYLMIFIGLVLLVIPGIYLAVAYGMALQLVAEKNLSPWQAMEASRKAITHKWFKIFGLYLVCVVLMAISAIPFGIGLVWSLPWAVIVFGCLYTIIFGYGEKETTMQ